MTQHPDLFELRSPVLSLGTPAYQQCGWVEILVALEKPPCKNCDDSVAWPDVTLGPR